MKEKKTLTEEERKQLLDEQRKHTRAKMDELSKAFRERGQYLVNEDRRLTQIQDYVNNALRNPDTAYEQNGIPIYRSGTVTNQLLHTNPDTFCEQAVRFLLPEYLRILDLYPPQKPLHRALSYIPTPTKAWQLFIPTINHINTLRRNRLRRESIQSAVKSLQTYLSNYDLIAADDPHAQTYDLPINRLAQMIDYLQFLDPTPQTHTNLFRFLATLTRQARNLNHRQLKLHNDKKTKKH